MQQANRIYCEDTRKLKDILRRLDVNSNARFVSLPGNSEGDISWADEFQNMNSERKWVLVSDAGTPLVSDPGWSLVHYCQKSNIPYVALPGACAPILAWQWSGGFGLPYAFAGFAPKASEFSQSSLDHFFNPLGYCKTFCFFDTRHQVLTTLHYLISSGRGAVTLYMAREMTKPHEELIKGNAQILYDLLSRRMQEEIPVGELTFVLEGQGLNVQPQSGIELSQLVQLRNLPPKAAAKLAAKLSAKSVQECYQAFVGAKRESNND